MSWAQNPGTVIHRRMCILFLQGPQCSSACFPNHQNQLRPIFKPRIYNLEFESNKFSNEGGGFS